MRPEDQRLGDLKRYWQSRKEEAEQKLAHIDALIEDVESIMPAETTKSDTPKKTSRQSRSSRRRKKKTADDFLAKLMKEHREFKTITDWHKVLGEQGKKYTRQAVDAAAKKLVQENVAARKSAPPGAAALSVYGLAELLEKEEQPKQDEEPKSGALLSA